MSSRVAGAGLALIAAALLATVIAPPVLAPAEMSLFAGHPTVSGHLRESQVVYVGLWDAQLCNNGGDGTCKSGDAVPAFRFTALGELALVGGLLLGMLWLGVLAIRGAARKAWLAWLLRIFGVLALGGGAALVFLEPFPQADIPLNPIAAGLYGGAILMALLTSFVAARKPVVMPRTSKRTKIVAPQPVPPGFDAMFPDEPPDRRDGRRPHEAAPGDGRDAFAPQPGADQPLFSGAPQLRPLYDATPLQGGTGGLIGPPADAAAPLSWADPVRAEPSVPVPMAMAAWPPPSDGSQPAPDATWGAPQAAGAWGARPEQAADASSWPLPDPAQAAAPHAGLWAGSEQAPHAGSWAGSEQAPHAGSWAGSEQAPHAGSWAGSEQAPHAGSWAGSEQAPPAWVAPEAPPAWAAPEAPPSEWAAPEATPVAPEPSRPVPSATRPPPPPPPRGKGASVAPPPRVVTASAMPGLVAATAQDLSASYDPTPMPNGMPQRVGGSRTDLNALPNGDAPSPRQRVDTPLAPPPPPSAQAWQDRAAFAPPYDPSLVPSFDPRQERGFDAGYEPGLETIRSEPPAPARPSSETVRFDAVAEPKPPTREPAADPPTVPALNVAATEQPTIPARHNPTPPPSPRPSAPSIAPPAIPAADPPATPVAKSGPVPAAKPVVPDLAPPRSDSQPIRIPPDPRAALRAAVPMPARPAPAPPRPASTTRAPLPRPTLIPPIIPRIPTIPIPVIPAIPPVKRAPAAESHDNFGDLDGDAAHDGGETTNVTDVPSAESAPAVIPAAAPPAPSRPTPKLPVSTAPDSLPPPKDAKDAAGPSPACPQCESPMTWVEEHLRFYCKSCRMYF